MTIFDYVDSPIETLLLTSDGSALSGLYMVGQGDGPAIGADWIRDGGAPVLAEARGQLAAYFAGTLQAFRLPLAARGTAFQQRVWDELQRIPFGTTISYGELAARVGNPKASRAVGAANGRNPISIVVPCHRVIGASGHLVGYGGGLPRKERLLALEASALRG